VKKNIFIVALLCLMVYGLSATAEEGKDIFESLRCGNCHMLDTGKVTPSLEAIAQAYKGKEDQLISFLQGEAEPIINPSKGTLMKKQIEKTKTLKETEMKALATFIMSFGH
jgi:cytochrome c551/c552